MIVACLCHHRRLAYHILAVRFGGNLRATAGLFVHIYGTAEGLWTISNGLTITQRKEGALSDWVKQAFGAEDIEQSELDVGCTVEGVWRPGLYYDKEVLQGLAETDPDLRLAEQSLLLLIEKLDELLLFIGPTKDSLETYSHKARELLILACTEVETQWKHSLQRGGVAPAGQNFTTNDYVRLCDPLYLKEYEVTLPRYAEVPPMRARPLAGLLVAGPPEAAARACEYACRFWTCYARRGKGDSTA